MGHVDDSTRICKKCGVRKPFSEFHKMRSGYKTKCRDCCSEIASNYWGQNKEKLRAQADERIRIRSEPNRIFISTFLKGNACVDCGESNWLVLEFDHVRGEKRGNVSELMLHDLDVVVEEVEKCEVVCSNCHKLRTMQRKKSWRLDYV